MAASTSAVRAGQAFVEMLLDNKQFLAALGAVQTRLKSMGAAFAAAGRKMSQAGTWMMAAGAAIAAPLVLAVREFMRTGDALDKMSARVSASVEFLSALGHAAQLGGSDLNTMEGAIRRMQRTALDATRGLSTAVDGFDMLGVSITGAGGQLKDTEQLFIESATALSKMENGTQKAALATMIFGRAGTQLLPMLQDGKAGLLAMMEEAKRLGLVMTEEDTKAAAVLTDAWYKLFASLKRSGAVMATALAPALSGTFDQVTAIFTPLMEWARGNEHVIVTVATLAAGLLTLGAAAKVLGLAITFLAAHPLVLAFMAAAAAAIALGIALSDASKEMACFSNEARKALAAGDKQRAASIGHMRELQDLADKERLNNQEMARAQGIIENLTKVYGDLGLSIDQTTGKIIGLTEAQRQLKIAMQEAAEAEQRAALAESMARSDEKIRQMQTATGWERVTFRSGQSERVKRLEQEINAELKRQEAILLRIKALRGGDEAALTGRAAGGLSPEEAAGRAKDEDEKLRNEKLGKEADLLHRQQVIWLGMIEDRQKRELELIDEKYDHEIHMAKLAGKTIEGMEETRQLELSAARKRHAKEESDQRIENRKAAKDRDDERFEREKDVQHDVARLEIETSELTAAEKESALMDLQHKRERAEATAAGLDMALLVKKQDLERRALEAGEGVGAAEERIGVSGTFSAFAAARMGGASSAPERTAKATETSARLLESINKNFDQIIPAFTG